MCTICGLKKEPLAPIFVRVRSKHWSLHFAHAIQEYFCWKQVNLSGNLLPRESPFHNVNCLKSFDVTLFFSYALKCWEAMGVRRNFSRVGQRRHFAYLFQVADDAIQMDVHKTLFPFPTKDAFPHKEKYPMLWQESQKFASLAAIPMYITIIILFKKAVPRSLAKSQIMNLFYVARLVRVSSKQELQTSGNSLWNHNSTLMIK